MIMQAVPFIVLVMIVLEPLFFWITKWEKTEKRRAGVITGFLALILGIVIFWSNHPIISCPEEYREQFTSERRAEAIWYSKYNGSPFIPLKITVLEIREDSGVSIETLYFLGGKIEMSYDGADGLPSIDRSMR